MTYQDLVWTRLGDEQLAGQRVIYISDGQEGYIAFLPAAVTQAQAFKDFVSSYAEIDEGERVQLAADMTAAVIPGYDPTRNPLDQAEEEK